MNDKKHQIIPKPWGQEELLEVNERYMVKRLTMEQGKRCSLQYHNKKRETIYILEGKLKICIGSDRYHLDERIFSSGDSTTIEPGKVHRMEGLTKAVYLEASTPELEDVIRLQDDFGRTG